MRHIEESAVPRASTASVAAPVHVAHMVPVAALAHVAHMVPVAAPAHVAALAHVARRAAAWVLRCMALILLISSCGRNSAESPISGEAPPGSQSLVLLFTGDMHSNLDRYPQLAELVERERAAAEERGVPILLLSTGDAPMGTIYHTLFTTNAADYRAMQLLGYDASALGNHDFDFGPDALLRSLAAADSLASALPSPSALPREQLPLLCANIGMRRDTSGRISKYLVLLCDSLKVLITATMGADAIRTTSAADSLNFTSPVEALRSLEPLFPKCDFYLLLSHGGTSWVGNEQITEETPSAVRRRRKTEDALLAAEVPLFDAILSGHDHAPLFAPLTVGKTVIGNPGANMQYLGRMEIAKDSAGCAYLVDYRLIPIPAAQSATQSATTSHSASAPYTPHQPAAQPATHSAMHPAMQPVERPQCTQQPLLNSDPLPAHVAEFVGERYREVEENLQRVYGIALPDTLLLSLAATKFATFSTPDLVAECYSTAPALVDAASAPAAPAMVDAAGAPVAPALVDAAGGALVAPALGGGADGAPVAPALVDAAAGAAADGAPAAPAMVDAAGAPVAPALAEERPIGIVPFGLVRGELPRNCPITWRHLFELLSLGRNREGLTGYPLVKLYLYGSELFDICELDASYAKEGNDLHLHFSSNLKYYGRALGIPFLRVTDLFVNGEPVQKERLYPVVTDLFTAESIRLLKESSYGLLEATPKDSSGRVVMNPAAHAILMNHAEHAILMTPAEHAIQVLRRDKKDYTVEEDSDVAARSITLEAADPRVELTGWMALGLMLSSQAPE